MPECLFNSVSIFLQQSVEVPQLMDTVLLRQCLVAAESRTETCNDLLERWCVVNKNYMIPSWIAVIQVLSVGKQTDCVQSLCCQGVLEDCSPHKSPSSVPTRNLDVLKLLLEVLGSQKAI